jgi:glycosyltransferase involved in cell wall biosynthesis
MKRGLVSVVMPTYKRSEKLTRAIDSVLNQTYTKIELLLVNDNNPEDDYTKTLIERIKKIRNRF